MKNILSLLIILGAFYIGLGIFLFIFQSSLLYHPTNQDFFNCPEFSEYETIVQNGTRAYYLNQNSNSIVVHYHGNAGSTCNRALIKNNFEKSNKSVLFVEYAGYSNHNQSPSKQKILQDTYHISTFIQNYSNVTLFGQSLGAAVASYHSTHSKVNSLHLVAPFTSVKDIAKNQFPIYPTILVRENYDTKKWLKSYNNSIKILHGTQDRVIPQRFSKQLYESLSTQNKTYIKVENYGHNDIWQSQEFQSLARGD